MSALDVIENNLGDVENNILQSCCDDNSQEKVADRVLARNAFIRNKVHKLGPPKLEESAEIDLSMIEDDSNHEETNIKLTTPSKFTPKLKDDVDNWFYKRVSIQSVAQSKVKKRSELKKQLEKRLAEQRQEGITMRREIFNADNELFGNDEEEETNDDEEEENVTEDEELSCDKRDKKSEKSVEKDEETTQSYITDPQDDETNDYAFNHDQTDKLNSIADQSENGTFYEESVHGSASDIYDEEELAVTDRCNSLLSKRNDNENSINLEQNDNSNCKDSLLSNQQCTQSQSFNFNTQSQSTPLINSKSTDKIAELNVDELEKDSFGECSERYLRKQKISDAELEFLLNDEMFLNCTDSQNLKLAAQMSDFDSEKNTLLFLQKEQQLEMPNNVNVVDEDDDTVNVKKSKRKLWFDSDDEEEAETSKTDTSDLVPKKIRKCSNENLFTVDDDEDRVEMDAIKPFADQHTVRLVVEDFDDDDDEPQSSALISTFKDTEEQQSEAEQFNLKGTTKKNISWIENEAELSGDDEVSDDEENSDDEDLDMYEPEAGDQDELPDVEKMRSDLVKTHLKLQNIDEERHLNKLKERYEDQLNSHSKWDRSFRPRLHDSKLDFSSLVGDPLGIDEDERNSQQVDDQDEPEVTFLQYWKQKEEKEKQDEQVRIFSMAACADELVEDLTESKSGSNAVARRQALNSHTMAKFVVENFYFNSDHN